MAFFGGGGEKPEGGGSGVLEGLGLAGGSQQGGGGFQRMLDSVQETVGLKEKEPTLLGQFEDSITLTKTQRFKGFLVCFGTGVALSFLGFFLFWTGSTNGFAVTYTLGNLFAMGSTLMLFGPITQCKNMFKARRIWATLIYVVFMILTLVSALYLKDTFFTLLCIICQMAALTWYCASYIPFAQRIMKKVLGNCIGDLDGDGL